jgi:hypothetical protein
VCRSLEPATASATAVLGRLGDAPANRCKVAGSRLRRRPGCGRSPATRVSCRGVGSNECVALSRTTSVSFVAAGPCRPPPVPLSSDVVRWPLGCRVADASSETGRTSTLTDLYRLIRPGGLFAATVTYGVTSRLVTDGWVPGRYFARWRKDEFARAVRRAGWLILELGVVTNRERKGRWLNLLAQRQG